jgi:hypothetical protein
MTRRWWTDREKLATLDRQASAIAAMETLLDRLDDLGAGIAACHQSMALEALRAWTPGTPPMVVHCLSPRSSGGTPPL